MEEKNLRKIIEEKITQGDITKKARWYFVVRRIIAILGGILAFCLAIYFASFIFFLFNDQGIGFLTDFGWQGGVEILLSLPWLIIILLLFLIAIIELVGWRFIRLYRQPFLYSMLGVVVIILAASALIEYTHLHRRLSESAEQDHLPVAGYFYKKLGYTAPKDVYFGIVIKQAPEEWEVETRGAHIPVIITPHTRFPRGNEIIPQDQIIIIGPMTQGKITAHGIREITPEMMPRRYIKKNR